jgi:hypothetical protein
VNHSGGFCEVVKNLLMRRPAVRDNLRVKLEKVTLTSRTKIAAPSSLADQRNQESQQIGPAAELLEQDGLPFSLALPSSVSSVFVGPPDSLVRLADLEIARDQSSWSFQSRASPKCDQSPSKMEY